MSKNKKGFTLVEVLVVVLIIGILGAIALPQYMTSVERARVTSNMSVLKPIYDSALQYYSFNDEFPDSLKKLPVSMPESYRVSGLRAVADDGSCEVAIDASNKAVTMECGKGDTAEYKFVFKYTINDSGTIFGAGKYFVVLAAGNRGDTFHKVATSSGWTKEADGYKLE